MKEKLARVIGKSGVASALLRAQRWGVSPFITILTYHRAADATAMTEYDGGVVDVSPEAFDDHLGTLSRFCNVITNQELLAFVRGKGKLPKNPVLVTFDDGYLDNHDVVLPILEKHGMTATFFIATSYIEERRLFWWDRINFYVKTSKRERLEMEHPCPLSLSLATAKERAASIKTLLRIVKDTYALDLDRFLDDLSRAADVSLSREEERRRVDAFMMTWDHIRALRRAGMEIQSHTQTHRVVQTLTPERLAGELSGSRAFLEEVLGEEVRAISYPVGKPIRESPHIRDAVRAAGYEIGFSNSSGVNTPWRFDPLDMRRLSTEGLDSPPSFRALLAVPYLAYSRGPQLPVTAG